MAAEREYVLGTHDAEIERLGVQHGAWRELAQQAWQRAGFTAGETLIDVGCGPGYAALDLAARVGPQGRVVGLDRSRRFLDHMLGKAAGRGLRNVEGFEVDLGEGPLPVRDADGAWSRWVFSFVRQPRRLLDAVRDALRPGATLLLHEYFAYDTFKAVPHEPWIARFVAAVMQSWRDDGGEPDIALQILPWLADAGFDLVHAAPIARVARPGEPAWAWLTSFLDTVGPERLVKLGRLPAESVTEIRAALARLQRRPAGMIIAPTVMEIVARRR